MFDDRLRKLREASGRTAKQVALDLELPPTTYSNYERDIREPSALTLIKIAAYFNVSIDYLCGYKSGNEKSLPHVINERESLAEILMKLDDDSLLELEKFVDYLLWKEEQN